MRSEEKKDHTSQYEGYESHFKGEKPLHLTGVNKFYVNSYLNEVKKRSDYAYYNNKSVIRLFFEYINKPADKITKIDVRNYFRDVIDKKNLKKDTKNTYRAYLSSFFDFVESIQLKKDIDFSNPVPSKRIFQFTKKPTDIKKKSEQEIKLLTKKQIFQIIEYCKRNKSKRHFIFFGLAICTGARCSELLSIKIDNINLGERFLETGFEKNARKSTRIIEDALMFFIPRRLTEYLKNYILTLDSEEWLFPSPSKPDHIGTGFAEYSYRQIRKALSFHFSMHYFRHSLITYLKANECPQDIREGLLNHVPSSTQGRRYEHLDTPEKRALYDKYFPYYSIKYF